jgi:hypothetical protein
VCHRQLQFGRLGDHRRVRRDMAQCLLDPEAGVLLIRDRRDHQVPGQPQSRHLSRGHQPSRDARLHVISPAAGQPVTVDPRRVRSDHVLHIERIDVPTQP